MSSLKKSLPAILYTAILVSVLTIFTAYASFKADMEMLAMNMAESLKLTRQISVRFTTVSEDKAYMLSLLPIYKALQKQLKPYVKDIRMNTFRGEEQTTIRSMILSGSAEYAPIGIYEQQVDSLILFGTYYLLEGNLKQVNFALTVINNRSENLFQSNEYAISKTDCPPAIIREVFVKIRDKHAFGRIAYKGKLIIELNNLFNSANNNLLAYPAEYRFEKRHPYAIQWQVDMLKEILSLKYGIFFNSDSKNSIIVEPTGMLVFIRNGKERQIDRVIDGEPLLPVQFLEEFDSLHYIYSSMHTSAPYITMEAKPYVTAGEKTIRDRIYETFHTYYPQLFTSFNYDLLNKIYIDKGHPSILVGTKLVSDPRTGKEIINYSWHSKQSWLAGLKKARAERNRTFDVDTYVMGIFNDNLDPYRYWAIIAQKWKTKDLYGNVVYNDDGFLIVNFDFDANLQLKGFAIHYRLWFYNYQYDNCELGITRYEKLIKDLNRHFVNGLHGIDSTLKQAMRDFLIEKIRSISMNIK